MKDETESIIEQKLHISITKMKDFDILAVSKEVNKELSFFHIFLLQIQDAEFSAIVEESRILWIDVLMISCCGTDIFPFLLFLTES